MFQFRYAEIHEHRYDSSKGLEVKAIAKRPTANHRL